MNTSDSRAEKPDLLELTSSVEFASRVSHVIGRIRTALDEGDAVDLLAQAADRLGADAACFVTLIREDAMQASIRFLLACDPVWGTDYARNRWFRDDPWLTHAMSSIEPACASTLAPQSAAQQAVVAAAEQAGFRSAVIVPAPSAAGEARAAALYLGSRTPEYFEGEGYASVRLFARMLAMELHDWWIRKMCHELRTRARITEHDLELLRHEAQGHGSKAIAAALNTAPQTIDCRFQRLNLKLGVANRRAAVRLAKLYGLI